MDVIAGATLTVPLQVKDPETGDHVDPDGQTVTAVLSSHPSATPAITRNGVGRYVLTWTNLDPVLNVGQTLTIAIDGAIDSDAWTTYQLPIHVVGAAPVAVVDADTALGQAAALPRKTQAGGEYVEEHPLAELLAHERWKKQQENNSADKRVKVHRSRLTHRRP